MFDRSDLPDGWTTIVLSDHSVATINPKKSEIRALQDGTSVTFVPMAAVDETSGTITSGQTRLLGSVRKGYTYFRENDVIFAKITPCMENGKCAVGRELESGIGFASTEFHVVRAGERTTPGWLHVLLRSQQLREDAKNHMHGAAGQQRVPVEFLEQLEIPIPPMAEQRRIVGRITALTDRVETLRTLNASLVDDISAALALLYGQMTRDAIKVQFGEVANLVRRRVEVVADETYPELGIRSFGNGTFPKPALSGQQLGNKKVYRIRAGDLMVMIIFAWEGAIAVAQPEDAGRVGSHRFLSHEVDASRATPEFLCYHLLSTEGIEHIRAASPGSAGRNRTLSTAKLKRIPIPLPLLPEQVRFTQLYKLRTKLQRLQHEVEADLAAFTPALLAKAFRGEL